MKVLPLLPGTIFATLTSILAGSPEWHFEFLSGVPNKLVWQTEVGLSYNLEVTTDLTTWNQVEGFPRSASGDPMEYPFTPTERGFFRISSSVPNDPKLVFFSEYVEGSSFNKALEVFNGTGATIDLAAEGWDIQIFFNGSVTAGATIALSGSLSAGGVFVLAHPSADAELLSAADQITGSVNFNGDDAVMLRRGGAVIDVIGQIGVDPGSAWGSGGVTTANHTLRRKNGIVTGDADGSDAFDPADEWDGFATDTFSGVGTHEG